MTETHAERPLFIPLKGVYFDAFDDGSKNTEYRLYGPRWNERTCRIGRRVVLSRGYGKQRRRHGVVIDFWKDAFSNEAIRACYPHTGTSPVMACIQIKVED